MRSYLSSTRHRGVAVVAGSLLAGALTAALASTPASATESARSTTAPHRERAVQIASETVRSGKADRSLTFYRGHAGEAFLKTTVSARGVSWADPGNESAVVSVYVDGHYATDIVITSAVGVRREFALGHLAAGKHTLRLHYATTRSRSDAGVARLQQIAFWTVRPSSRGYVAAEYAPILYGRDDSTRIPKGNRFANDHTDTPLVAWHEIQPATKPGHSIIQYSVVWSNEDGGTATSSLMARWGRTTDIEWIYRVEVNAQGKRVKGSGVFQGSGHGTDVFQGSYDGTHPILQTCTTNNNVCDSKALKALKQKPDPMRFALSARNTLAPGQTRERLMDRHPWTYQVMAQEMQREGKVEPAGPADPGTAAMSDQRNYLYLALTRSTDPGSDAADLGLAVDVKLKGDDTVYSSDHLSAVVGGYDPDTINRDGPAATTVELPVGTTADDIEWIGVRRAPYPFAPASDATVSVTSIQRAFFLDGDYLPQKSFIRWQGDVDLTPAAPTAQVWPVTG